MTFRAGTFMQGMSNVAAGSSVPGSWVLVGTVSDEAAQWVEGQQEAYYDRSQGRPREE